MRPPGSEFFSPLVKGVKGRGAGTLLSGCSHWQAPRLPGQRGPDLETMTLRVWALFGFRESYPESPFPPHFYWYKVVCVPFLEQGLGLFQKLLVGWDKSGVP